MEHETFQNLNFDEDSPNYLPRKVGDRFVTIDSQGKLTNHGDYPNQSKYIRTENTPITQETNSKILREIVNSKKKNRKNKSQTLQDIVYFYFKGAYNGNVSNKNIVRYSDYYSNRYPNYQDHADFGFIEKMYGYSDQEISAKISDLTEEKNSSAIIDIMMANNSFILNAIL